MKRPSARIVSRTCAVLVLAGLTGCIPEKRVVWSPDGRRAAVIGGDGLRLCDGEGRLSPGVVPGARLAAWTPDSRRLVVARVEAITRWADLNKKLRPARSAAITKLAEAVRAEALAYEGDPKKFEPASAKASPSRDVAAAILHLRDNNPEGLKAKFGEQWDELADVSVDFWIVQCYDVTDSGATAGPIVMEEFERAFNELRLSPDGAHVALVCPGEAPGEDLYSTLLVAAVADHAESREVATLTSRFPDWTRDGRGLAYIRSAAAPAEGGKTLQLGSLSRRAVLGADGKMLAAFRPAEDLAGLVFDPYLSVRCTPDGDILFTAMDVRLPCTARDMPNRLTLFSVDPDRRATVARALPRDLESSFGQDAVLFEISPDGRKLSLPSMDGSVAVVRLADGHLTRVQSAGPGDGELLMIPVWRSADELCLALPPGSPEASAERGEVALWSERSGARVISRQWPAEVARDFLIPEKNDAKATATASGTAIEGTDQEKNGRPADTKQAK